MRIRTRWSIVLIASIVTCTSSWGQTSEMPPAKLEAAQPQIFFLALRGGVRRTTTQGAVTNIVPSEAAGVGPDGIAIDHARRHIYWTTMGKGSADDGSIMRADLDGRNVRTIVPAGGTFTPKQLELDNVHRKLYWSDREGMRVMRANLDGSNIETLVVTGKGDAERKDASRWCVGIAIDTQGGKLYWSQKGGDNARKGTIKRANRDLPAGMTAATRSDIEVLFADLPEPIDLDIDVERRLLYWTDRGDNTISRAPLDPPAQFDPAARTDRDIVMRDVGEVIGIALDTRRERLYYTSLGGVLGMATLSGGQPRLVLTNQGALTGVALFEE